MTVRTGRIDDSDHRPALEWQLHFQFGEPWQIAAPYGSDCRVGVRGPAGLNKESHFARRFDLSVRRHEPVRLMRDTSARISQAGRFHGVSIP